MAIGETGRVKERVRMSGAEIGRSRDWGRGDLDFLKEIKRNWTDGDRFDEVGGDAGAKGLIVEV